MLFADGGAAGAREVSARPQAAAGPREAPGGVERRQDPTDDAVYTQQEFLEALLHDYSREALDAYWDEEMWAVAPSPAAEPKTGICGAGRAR